MRIIKSRIAELELDGKAVTTSALLRRDIAYSHRWKNEEHEFLGSLCDAMENGQPKLAYAYYNVLSNGLFYDSIRICNYREAIWRAIKEIKAGMPGEDIIAHLESVLDKLKDGIEMFDISEEEYEKRYPSPPLKSGNKQNRKEVIE